MSWARRCPDPVDLARAASEQREGDDAHLSACGSCRAEVEAQRRFLALARGLPAPAPGAERVEAVRSAVLAAACAPPPPRRAWWRSTGAIFAAAAAVALLLAGGWLSRRGHVNGHESTPAAGVRGDRTEGAEAGRAGPERTESTLAALQRGPPELRAAIVQPHPGARHTQTAGPPDQIVRLSEGTLTVSVAPLGPGERFRVLVGRAEVEVHGTAFDVTARANRLVEVRVLRGRVAVRPEGRGAVLLSPGERWGPPAEAAPAPGPTPAPAPAEAPSEQPPRVKASARPVFIARSEPRTVPAAKAPEPRVLEAPAPSVEARAAVPACQAADREVSSPTEVEAEEQGPTPAEAAFEQGFALLRSGEPAQAALSFDRAARAAGGEGIGEDASYWRAVALGRAARPTEAARAFRHFLGAFPDSNRSGEAEAMLGRLLLSQGDAAGARRLFEAASGDAAPRVRKAALHGLELTRDLSPSPMEPPE
jgi:TolA-binding protein